MTRLHAQTPATPATPEIMDRLEALRAALRAENISMGELIELQDLQDYIPEGDVELLEAAGVPEFPATTTETRTYLVTLTISSDEESTITMPSGDDLREPLALYLLDENRTIPADSQIDLRIEEQ